MKKAKNILPIPALPIIQSAVMSLAPTFGGGRHDGHMNVLCAYVRGEKTEADLASYLKDNKLEATKDNDFALFLGEKRAEQSTACAAYIASSVLIAPNLGEFLEPVKEAKPKAKDAGPEFSINQEKLTVSLTTKLAIALANSDLFALIAGSLPEGLTVEGYRAEVCRLFGVLAPVYLERVQIHYQNGLQFNLLQMQNNQFTFNSSTGYLFHYDVQGLSLQLGGINWYGRGQIMGQDYVLNVDYFSDKVVELLK
ncbi:Uncharacterised protein [Pragia fontium]|uniref:hypothetical protein n=1 Tax=Pragia fontium TaxID=82985 RepID=UPI000DFA2735|nr:hypothetical protein [Pragia fontium]SUB81292.1 Uncharacterised protein [Pragia fontium]